VKKLLDSSLALALASGFLFCLGRSYQEAFLRVYGLESVQFETSAARTLLAGFMVFYNWLRHFWFVILVAWAIFGTARYAPKRVSMMMSSLRQYRRTFIVLGALLVFLGATAYAQRSGKYGALENLRRDQHPLPNDRKNDDYVTRETLRLKNNPNEEIVGWLIAQTTGGDYAFYESRSRTVWLVRKEEVQSIALTLKDGGGREVLGNHR